jgi:hypothetical protein
MKNIKKIIQTIAITITLITTLQTTALADYEIYPYADNIPFETIQDYDYIYTGYTTGLRIDDDIFIDNYLNSEYILETLNDTLFKNEFVSVTMSVYEALEFHGGYFYDTETDFHKIIIADGRNEISSTLLHEIGHYVANTYEIDLEEYRRVIYHDRFKDTKHNEWDYDIEESFAEDFRIYMLEEYFNTNTETQSFEIDRYYDVLGMSVKKTVQSTYRPKRTFYNQSRYSKYFFRKYIENIIGDDLLGK